MPKYLPPNEVGGSLAIAVCARCRMKRYLTELTADPNNGLRVCIYGCVDLYDPYRLPQKPEDQISLQYPRPDEPLDVPDDYPYGSE